MTSAAEALGPDRAGDLLAGAWDTIKEAFLRPRRKPATEVSVDAFENMVDDLVHALRVVVVAGGYAEALLLLGLDTLAPELKLRRRALALTKALTGIDLVLELKHNPSFEKWAPRNQHTPGVSSPSEVLAIVMAAAAAASRFAPITFELEEFGVAPEHTFALRELIAKLAELSARNESESNLRALGAAYAEGRLSLDEVAGVMGTRSEDAVQLLEKYGFVRPIEVIQMSEAERARALATIRADRTERQGKIEPHPRTRYREVVASQRIENVDGRRWLVRTKA